MNDEQVLEELKRLIKEGRAYSTKLKEKSEDDGSNKAYYDKLRKWELDASNLLKLRFGEDSDFYREFRMCMDLQYYRDKDLQKYTYYGWNNKNGGFTPKRPPLIMSDEYYKKDIELATATLESIYESLSKGLTEDLFYRRELILFGDLLKQAEEFLEKGHRVAAAIYGRILLEATIKEFAKKNGMQVRQKEKFNQLIIELRKKGHIHEPFEESLRANYKIGSLAAHADEKFDKISESEIREFLSFIRDKVLTLE